MSWDSVPTTLLFGIRLPYQLRWEYVFNNKEWFIDGLKIALWMALVSLVIGSIIGLLCAFVRSSGNRPLGWLVTGYVELIRNIPLLLIVFIFYFGLPQFWPRHSWQHDWILKLLPTAKITFMVAL